MNTETPTINWTEVKELMYRNLVNPHDLAHTELKILELALEADRSRYVGLYRENTKRFAMESAQ